MGRTITVNGQGYTSWWRQYESKWTSRAHMGEAAQSEFVFDDDNNDIDHSDFASRKIIEVWDDASGVNVCLYSGRVMNKTLKRGDKAAGNAMRWIVSAEDRNVDLKGIRITDSVRPSESDRERVLAMMAGYLNGAASTNAHARDSTDLDGTYVINTALITLLAETYTDTFPVDVFNRISEMSAKNFFVTVADDGALDFFYAPFADLSYASTIELTDVLADVDGVDVYAPHYESVTGEHEGQTLISGGGVRYGDDQFYEESDIGSSEADHDKWEEHFQDDYINTASDAERFLENIVASRNNENFSFVVTIHMDDSEVHRIKAGMTLSYRMAATDVQTPVTYRAVQVQCEPYGPGVTDVTIELGWPRGRPFQRHLRPKPVTPPTPTTPPGPPTPGSTSWTYSWNFESNNLDTGTGTVAFMLGRADGPGTLTSWWGDSGGGSNSGLYTKQAVTAGGSININGKFAKNRLSTLSTSYLTIRWFANIADVNYTSSTTVPIGASGSKPGVYATVANSTTVPTGISAVRIDVDNNLFADDLTISHTGAATPGTAGVAGSGLAELVGTQNSYALADHTDIVFRDAGPTITDDEEHGFPEKTTWLVVDDPDAPTIVYEVWYLLDNTNGAAVWAQEEEADEEAVVPASLSQVSTMHRFPVWGHRGDIGSSDSLPENTLESVRQVALKGGQGAEIDVRLSSEGTFYLMHDSTVDRTTSGTGAIASKTDSQIDALTIDGGYGYISGSYDVPTLESVLDAVNPYDFVLSIQLNASSDDNAAALAQFILDGGWSHRCVIEVSTLSEAAAIKAVSPALTTMVNNTVSGAAGDDNVDWLSMERATVTSLSVVTGKVPQHVKSYITIADFPADETSIIQNMWDRGVSAYQTDDLDFALEAQHALLYGGTTGEPTADAHIADTTDAHDASAVSISDAGGYFTSTDVEGALQEVAADVAAGIGEILISDSPSTPLVFADLVQNEAQTDLVYGDP